MLESAKKGYSRSSVGAYGAEVGEGITAAPDTQAHSETPVAASAGGTGAGAAGGREQLGPEQGACFWNGCAGGMGALVAGMRMCSTVTRSPQPARADVGARRTRARTASAAPSRQRRQGPDNPAL